MKGLQEKVVVVTGGSGGIGAALCERFAEEGAKVAIFDLNAEGAGQVAASQLEFQGAAGQAGIAGIPGQAQHGGGRRTVHAALRGDLGREHAVKDVGGQRDIGQLPGAQPDYFGFRVAALGRHPGPGRIARPAVGGLGRRGQYCSQRKR